MNKIIKIENLNFGYSKDLILKDLSFEIQPGSFTAIAGPNGSGKSTLVKLLSGMIKTKSSNIKIGSMPIKNYSEKKLAQKVAVVHQEHTCAFDFSVYETVAMARTIYMGPLGFESSDDKDIINNALRLTDTLQFASRPINQLSGGEKQRVFIARAIAQDTDILILDEPTSFLDLKHQVGIYDLLKKIQLEKSKTIVCVTHDINLTGQYCDKVLLLGSKKHLFGNANEVFSPETIQDFFAVKTNQITTNGQRIFLPVGDYQQKIN